MTKLSIFQFSFGDGYAGSARIALQSTELLSLKGHSVTMFVSKSSLTEQRGLSSGLNIIPCDSSIPFKQLKEQIYTEYKKLKPVIIIGHHSLDRKLGLSFKRKLGNDIINIAYRHNVSKSVPFIGSIIYNRYADYLIACSRGVRNSLVSSGIKDKKIEVIHNGIPVPEGLDNISGTDVKNKYSLSDKKVLGLSTWFHKERKGFDILFKAFSKLSQDYVLLLVGITGEDKNKVIDYAAEFGITEDRLILPGYVENIYEYYKAMDLFLLPSRSEGFSLALLEAAAAKVPVIASNIPGNNEFIRNGVNGVLFNIEKPDELASNIELLLSDRRMMKAFTECAYRNLINEYTLQNYGARLENFLINAVRKLILKED